MPGEARSTPGTEVQIVARSERRREAKGILLRNPDKVRFRTQFVVWRTIPDVDERQMPPLKAPGTVRLSTGHCGERSAIKTEKVARSAKRNSISSSPPAALPASRTARCCRCGTNALSHHRVIKIEFLAIGSRQECLPFADRTVSSPLQGVDRAVGLKHASAGLFHQRILDRFLRMIPPNLGFGPFTDGSDHRGKLAGVVALGRVCTFFLRSISLCLQLLECPTQIGHRVPLG